jgi:hypothetical protein
VGSASEETKEVPLLLLTKLEQMTQEERETLIYLAGLIDADGYLSIVCLRSNQRLSPSYFEKVGLKQTCDVGPLLLKKMFGGCYGTEKPSTPNGKLLYRWAITGRKAAECARRLRPFLRIKQQQADILLLLQEHKLANDKNRKLTEDQLAHRAYLQSEVRALNDTRDWVAIKAKKAAA